MGQRFGQRVQSGLGRAVGFGVGAGVDRGRARHVDDAAAVPVGHALPDHRREPERSLQVHSDHLVEQRLADLGQAGVERRHAGVVDQHVDLAEPFVDGVDEPIDLIPVTGMAGVGEPLAAHRLDLRHHLAAGVDFPAGDDDVGAGGEGKRHFTAQSAAAAGDQSSASGEIEMRRTSWEVMGRG